jgi:hypothetical protein
MPPFQNANDTPMDKTSVTDLMSQHVLLRAFSLYKGDTVNTCV